MAFMKRQKYTDGEQISDSQELEEGGGRREGGRKEAGGYSHRSLAQGILVMEFCILTVVGWSYASILVIKLHRFTQTQARAHMCMKPITSE